MTLASWHIPAFSVKAHLMTFDKQFYKDLMEGQCQRLLFAFVPKPELTHLHSSFFPGLSMVVLETGFSIFMWVCTKNRKMTTYKRIKTKDEGEEHKNFE